MLARGKNVSRPTAAADCRIVCSWAWSLDTCSCEKSESCCASARASQGWLVYDAMHCAALQGAVHVLAVDRRTLVRGAVAKPLLKPRRSEDQMGTSAPSDIGVWDISGSINTVVSLSLQTPKPDAVCNSAPNQIDYVTADHEAKKKFHRVLLAVRRFDNVSSQLPLPHASGCDTTGKVLDMARTVLPADMRQKML